MRAKREFRSRKQTEVAVLDALVDREGMTVFELRTRVDVEIDILEEALSSLKSDGLIETERADGQLVITPAERVIPDEPAENHDESVFEQLRDRLPF